jgi:hypothetical protein
MLLASSRPWRRALGLARDAPVLALTFHNSRFNKPTCVAIG